jgi:hypothetical protein
VVPWKLFARELFQFCNYAFEDSLPFDEQLPVKALKLALGTPKPPTTHLRCAFSVSYPTHLRSQRGTMR